MPTTIIETLLHVGRVLFGLRDALAQARLERKEKVAAFLGDIAATIETTAASIRRGAYPHGTCQELLSHSGHMAAAVGDLVGQKVAGELAAQLREVWQIEQLYGELLALPAGEGNRRLEVLDQAAGLFRATAAFVRVSR